MEIIKTINNIIRNCELIQETQRELTDEELEMLVSLREFYKDWIIIKNIVNKYESDS